MRQKLDLATGIYNKKTVTDMITDDINKTAVSDRNRQMFLMILDIDNFKSVNDSYGHYFGDEVIKAFADSLKLSVGGRGIVGRIGGDEFIVLIKDVTIEELRIMLKAMRERDLRYRLHRSSQSICFQHQLVSHSLARMAVILRHCLR